MSEYNTERIMRRKKVRIYHNSKSDRGKLSFFAFVAGKKKEKKV